MKKIIKIILIIIFIIVLLFIFNYLRINIFYIINKSNYKETINIEGNTNKYIPQAITYSNKYNITIQTSYNKNKKVSRIYITDLNNNKLIKTLDLKKSNNTINNLHVGGITTDNKTVWITNDYLVSEYSLEEIVNTKNNYIKSNNDYKLPIRGDFCLYKNNYLYIGDFFLQPFYKVPDNNPLLLQYNINNINYNEPNLIISLPKMVQGMEIDNENNFYFTTSFTYLINSNLLKYKNILLEKPSTYTFNNHKYKYYKFNKSNLISKKKLPPMAEGMFYKDNKLHILFESSTDAYTPALPKIRKVLTIEK